MFGDRLKSIRDGVLSLAYPSSCRVCGSTVESWDDGFACAGCWLDPRITRLLAAVTVCSKCGLPQSGRQRSDGATDCGRCAGFKFAAARACGLYSGALEVSVLALKAHPWVPNRLKRLIETTYLENHERLRADVVIPVPLHQSRLRERGFNQASLIARVVATAGGTRVDEGLLLRIKDTERHRAGMDAQDRSRSVSRAFALRDHGHLNRASVLLVDDVLTTGSTVDEAARTLSESGVARVSVLTVARVAQGGP